jgi:hypothetical protein
MTKIVYLMLALITVVGIGCATFNSVVTNDALISQLAVEAATARVLTEHPQWKKSTIEITSGAAAAIEASAAVSLRDVEAYVRDRIKWYNLTPEEQALLSVLITKVRTNLEDSFRAKGIEEPDREMVAVRQVLIWIHDAAKRQK